MTHISADVQRITLNASSCITISGGRTEQLYISAASLATSDFLSFLVVEHIRFFHGAIHIIMEYVLTILLLSEVTV